MIRNWLYCPACGWESREDVLFDSRALPFCPDCGAVTRQDWSHGQPPATDLGAPRLYQGIDAVCSSTRQAEAVAKKRAAAWTSDMQRSGLDMAWTVDGQAGDKQGGAREVTRRRGTAASYAGQGSRRSSAER